MSTSENASDLKVQRLNRILIAGVAVGVVAFGIALMVSPERAWRNLLMHNFYFLGISMMGAVFISTHCLARAGWHVAFRRVPEAMLGYAPVGAILMLAMIAGVPSIYEWAGDGGHGLELGDKAAFLNRPGFAIRMVGILGAWLVLSQLIIRNSRAQDASGDFNLTRRNVTLSGLFIVIFGLTFCLSAIDWLMSLEPHWYSTMYPWYVGSSVWVSSIAVMTIAVILLRRRGLLSGVNDHHLQDLGKFLFAFSVFWGYLWFSQYMLIWYVNIPEETTHFLLRDGPWFTLFVVNVLINLVIPFILLPAANKKRETLVLTVCGIIIAGHWLDLYILVMPTLMTEGPRLGFIEIGVGVGVACLFIFVALRSFLAHGTQPSGDPYLAESLKHHV